MTPQAFNSEGIMSLRYIAMLFHLIIISVVMIRVCLNKKKTIGSSYLEIQSDSGKEKKKQHLVFEIKQWKRSLVNTVQFCGSAADFLHDIKLFPHMLTPLVPQRLNSIYLSLDYLASFSRYSVVFPTSIHGLPSENPSPN